MKIICRTLFVLFLFVVITGFKDDAGGDSQVVTVCEGGSVVLHASASGAVTYQWYRDNMPVPGATGMDYKATQEGKYLVIAYNASSCPSDQSDVTQVKVLSSPSVQFPPLADRTYGDPSFTLGATGRNTNKPVWYTVYPEGVVRIDGDRVTILSVGEVEITAHAEGQCGPAEAVKQKLKINPANLTVIADAKKRYYGDPNPEFTVTCLGLVNTDVANNEEIISKMHTSPSGVFKPACSVSVTAPVGNYPILLNRISIPNYNITFQDGILEVDKRPLTVTAKDCLKVRDGKLCKGEGVTISGFVSGENESVLHGELGYSGAAMAALMPGKYPIIPGGLDADNYAINYVAGTLTILDRFADLAITKRSENKSVRMGDPYSYVLIVENKSDEPATKVVVTDVLPEGIEFISTGSVSDGLCTYDSGTHSLKWEIAGLAPHASSDLTYQVKSNVSGKVINTAQVSSDETDPKLENNTSSDVLDITGIMIPNVFTPNGDSRNETFVIPKLSDFSDNQLEIFDRLGNRVYQKKEYVNDWTGDSLNEGTYYYILKVKNITGEWSMYKGYVTLLRSKTGG